MLSGWTCMEDDVLSRGSPLKLERGDWLVFDNCGAYTFVLNPRFIRGTPAVLVREPDGQWTVARPKGLDVMGGPADSFLRNLRSSQRSR